MRFSLENQAPFYVGFLCSRISEPYTEELIHTVGFGDDKWIKKMVDPQNIIEIRLETSLIIDWMLAKGLTPQISCWTLRVG